MKNLLLFILALQGCTARDVTPDRLSLGVNLDADNYNARSYNVTLLWNIEQP